MSSHKNTSTRRGKKIGALKLGIGLVALALAAGAQAKLWFIVQKVHLRALTRSCSRLAPPTTPARCRSTTVWLSSKPVLPRLSPA